MIYQNSTSSTMKSKEKLLQSGRYYLEGNENDPYRIGTFVISGHPFHIRKRKNPTKKKAPLFIDTTKPKYTYISSLYPENEKDFTGDYKGNKFKLSIDMDEHSVRIELQQDEK